MDVRFCGVVHIAYLPEGALVTDVSSGRYLQLNETAATICELALTFDSTFDVAVEMAKRFDVSVDVAMRDVILFLTELSDEGIVTGYSDGADSEIGI